MDQRFLTESGPEIYLGNELLLKGALETPGGVHLLTGYPGSPVAAFFNAVAAAREALRDHGVVGTIASNEALSVAMVNGSQMAPLRAMTVIKSVGVHVASDGLALGNLAGAHPEGGAVVVYGDDPWSHSTQVPADSRYISEHLRIPVLEPSTCQEMKDWIALAFELSRRSGFYIGYMVTTELADGGGVVDCRPNHWPAVSEHQRIALDSSTFALEQRVLLPPRTAAAEARLPQRHRRLLAAARELGVDRLVGPSEGRFPVGFLTSGMAYQYLRHAAEVLDFAGRYPILKLGLTWPFDEDAVLDLARRVDHLVVIEERRGFIETHVSALLTRARQDDPGTRLAQVWGKRFPAPLPGVPGLRGLSPVLVVEVLAPLLEEIDRPTPRQRDSRLSVRGEERFVPGALEHQTHHLQETCVVVDHQNPGHSPASLCLNRKRFNGDCSGRIAELSTPNCTPIAHSGNRVKRGNTGARQAPGVHRLPLTPCDTPQGAPGCRYP